MGYNRKYRALSMKDSCQKYRTLNIAASLQEIGEIGGYVK